jgi:hypothetical protein
MAKRTYGEIKREMSRTAGQAGISIDDEILIDLVNLAQERLISKGQWSFLYAQLTINQFEGTLTLPSEYEALLGIAQNRTPAPIFDQWYEFLELGPGPQDNDNTSRWTPGAIDRGETPVILQPSDEAWRVSVFSPTDELVDDERPTVRVLGYDENGKWVRSLVDDVWHDGILLELRGDEEDEDDRYHTSTVKFSKVTGFQKPATNDYVELYFQDEFDDRYLAGRYRHDELTASFRSYSIPSIGTDETRLVHAWVRRRFRKVTRDEDEMMVGSLPALRFAIKAIAAEDKDDIVTARALLDEAVTVLRDEDRHRRPSANPGIEVRSVGAAGGVENLI